MGPIDSRQSISFDHAADFYDETRALPPEVASRLTEALLREIEGVADGAVLEVGVGTGRIARPLAERGVRVCGVDIAPRMLDRLRQQLTPRHLPPDLLLADATRLPLATARFRAIIICHVLHLVSDWRAAIDEMLRVLAPGGVLLHVVDERQRDDWRAALKLLEGLLRERGFVPSHRLQNEEINAALAAAGGRCRTKTIAERQERFTPAQTLELARRRIHSWTWEIPAPLLEACLREVELRVAAGAFGGLDAPLTGIVAYRLQVWSFPPDR